MENAAEALKTAAAVLIFVLALTISISAFGQARESAQIVVNYKDRDFDYDTYITPETTETIRKVGLESIVPAFYKAYKENYKIVFDKSTKSIFNGGCIYEKKDENGVLQPILSIDLEKETLGSDEQKEEFIAVILYGPTTEQKTKFYNNLGIQLKDKGIYDIIKEGRYTFEEHLGVYYQEELQNEEDPNNPNGAPEANKTKKRVITYSM